jgi:ankyrin repeat protein
MFQDGKHDGNTVLHAAMLARGNCNVDMVSLLLDSGAQVDVENKVGYHAQPCGRCKCGASMP